MGDEIPRNRPDRSRTRTLLRSVVAIDLLMMALLAVNVLLLIFDWIFTGSAAFRGFLGDHLTFFYDWYKNSVHENFALIDLVFVSVYVLELSVRWIIAVKKRIFHRWFFYPLVHWYDVLGCIPIGSLRFLRLLRLVAILYRSHKLGIIDIRKFYLFAVFDKYKEILEEEVSDRVVLHVLSGIQDELAESSGVVDRIWREAIASHADELWNSVKVALERTLQQGVSAHRPAVDAYVERVLTTALERSTQVFDSLTTVPYFGQGVVDQIETAIKTIVGNVVDQLLEDSKGLDMRKLTAQAERTITQALAEQDTQATSVLRQVVDQSIEIIKDQVKVQQWKVREDAERAAAGKKPTPQAGLRAAQAQR
jgi:hypothetical protein